METTEAWHQRVEEVLRSLGTELQTLRPLHGGACQDNYVVSGVDGRRWVLRADASNSLPGSLSRALEAPVVMAAVDAGVPTPAIRAVLPDLMRPGCTGVIMDFATGVAIGAKVVRKTAVHERLLEELAVSLASIHALRPDDVALSFDNPQNAVGTDAVSAALRFCRTMMDELPPRPSAERVYRWLDQHRPDAGPVVLVHGDFRVGNFLVGDEGLEAVLDWEFAHWGSAAEDLAWVSLRDWRFGRWTQAVGGIGSRADFLAAYSAAGAEVPPVATLRWWEVLGSLRWATGALFQTARALSGRPDLELLAIGRRAAEMEFEALRLTGILKAGV